MNRKFKKLTVAVLMTAVTFTFPLVSKAQEVTDSKQDADASVSGKVTSDISKPSYVISIPSAIDFGTLRQPSENINAYKDISFEVKLEQLSGLQEGQVVAVLVKDAQWSGPEKPTIPFAIKGNTQRLDYSVFAGSGSPDSGSAVKLFEQGRWYAKGFLYGTFGVGSAGQGIQGALRLNQKQLYNKEISQYEGSYQGTLMFHTAIASAADY